MNRPRRAPGRRGGSWRIGVAGLGLLALATGWAQQPTLASFVDIEKTKASFSARSLDALDKPAVATKASRLSLSWDEASGSWATTIYRLGVAATEPGTPASIYSGLANSYVYKTTGATPTSVALPFTKVAAGDKHACGIVRGQVYCWGTSSYGLGGATSPAKTPTVVDGLVGMTVTDIAAGTDFTCAVADGSVYCWGLGTNGRLGNGSTASRSAPAKVSTLSGRVTALSAGTAHACAVVDATAYCWGKDSSGQLGDGATTDQSTPKAVTGGALAGRVVGAISAGDSHSCAVADGMAFCWGLNTSGQVGDGSTTSPRLLPVAVDAGGLLMGRRVSEIGAGGAHSCAVAEGRVLCWGLGSSGQLGNSGTGNSSSPVQATGLTASATKVILGPVHSCALVNGTVYCWGSGVGSAPSTVSVLGRTVAQLSVGNNFACAVATDLPAACMGVGADYQLGSGSNPGSTTSFADVSLNGPRCAVGSVRLSDTSCSLVQGTSYYFTLGYSIGSWDAPDSAVKKATTDTRGALTPGGTPATTSVKVTWDAAPDPETSYADYTLERATTSGGAGATTIAKGAARTWTDSGGFATSRTFTQVSTGYGHSCGIVGGRLYCWGLNANGQLGIGNKVTQSTPTLVTTLSNVTKVSAGKYHTCAVLGDGSAYCWGAGGSGQLGVNNLTQYDTPVKVNGTTVWSDIAAGDIHTCAIDSAKAVWCWGESDSGRLGVSGASADLKVPTKVSDVSLGFSNANIASVAAGSGHSCVANSANAAYCWGLNGSGQLGNGGTSNSATAVRVKTGLLTNLSNVTSVTAGAGHSCANASGAAYCWGADAYGQLGNSSATSDSSYAVAVSGFGSGTTAIVAGDTHTCAIRSNNAYCWGLNSSGQVGNGATTNQATPAAVTTAGALAGATIASIGAGGAHSCLVTSGGAGYCWGSSNNGRLGYGGSITDTTSNPATPRQTEVTPRCASGAVGLPDGTCSLAAGTNYYYRLTYTLDAKNEAASGWTAIKTDG